jgi:hypothetical protein
MAETNAQRSQRQSHEGTQAMLVTWMAGIHPCQQKGGKLRRLTGRDHLLLAIKHGKTQARRKKRLSYTWGLCKLFLLLLIFPYRVVIFSRTRLL